MLFSIAQTYSLAALIIALVVILLLVIFKNVYYRRTCKIEYLGFGIICVIYVALKLLVKQPIVKDIVSTVLLIGLIVYSLKDLFEKEGIKNAFLNKANNLIKNAQFDYYYASNNKDIIIDFSESFTELTRLTPTELYDTLGFQTILSKLYITHVNGEDITSSIALKLNYDYSEVEFTKQTAYFEISVTDNNESFDLLGVVEPIFYKNKFIGRNVYFSKNNKHTLNKLQQGLTDAYNVIKDDRAQLYVMMSMMKDVVLYYDYNTTTYIMTETIAKALNLNQREYSINEFVDMIHPNDIQYYQEQSSVIGSLEVTRIKYRLKLGLGYYYVYEDAMYLNRDGKLISIIHLANYTPKDETKEEESEEIVESTKEVVKEKPQVDYKEKLEDTMKVLEKLLGE